MEDGSGFAEGVREKGKSERADGERESKKERMEYGR